LRPSFAYGLRLPVGALFLELASEAVVLNVVRRQLGHANLGITSVHPQGIDNAEIIDTVDARREPMIPQRRPACTALTTRPAPLPSFAKRSRGCCLAAGSGSSRPVANFHVSAEALALVKASPGITIHQIAEKMGIKQNYLYRVLPGLAEDGLVVKDGHG
jgi:hypothetical protein